MLQAWTNIYHQIFGGWKVYIMWNLQKNVWSVQRRMFELNNDNKWLIIGLPRRAWIEKTVHRLEKHTVSSLKKSFGRSGQQRSLCWHERIHNYWFFWKRWNCKQTFDSQLLIAKLTLIIEYTRVYHLDELRNIFSLPLVSSNVLSLYHLFIYLFRFFFLHSFI